MAAKREKESEKNQAAKIKQKCKQNKGTNSEKFQR
jgi:hypothetical protein